MSKGWCLGGLRLAFAIGAEPLISALRQVKAVVDFNQSLALQKGAITALTEWADWPTMLRKTYRERRDRATAALRAGGWSVSSPDMALYLWMPLPERAVTLGWDDERCAAELLLRSGVALTPGSGFGEAGRRWLRMALVQQASVLDQAVERLCAAANALV